MAVLSLCMIVRNEDKYLRDCLESVKAVADEVVIVDTGSTDNTIAIADEYGAQVCSFTWINDFSAARNVALRKCTGKWILYLDADERLSDKSVEELKRFIGKEEKIGVKCLVKSVDSENSRDNTMKYTRVFRNTPGIEFIGRVHEQIDPSLIKNNYKIINSGIEIIHLGYNISKDSKKEKAKRNLSLLLKDYEENNSSYAAFQLSQTYNILEDNDAADRYAIIAAKGKTLSAQQRAISYSLLSNNELQRHKAESALYYIKEGLHWDNTQPYINLLASKIYLRLQDLANAEEYCRRAYDANVRLVSGNNFSTLDIILNDDEILFYGIYLAKLTKNQRYFSLYINALKRYLEKKGFTNVERKAKILKKICLDESLVNNEHEEITCLINKNTLVNLLEILKLYKVVESRLKILTMVSKEYREDSSFAEVYGLALADNNMIDEACKILEPIVESKKADASTLFYLISLCIKKNNFEKIPFYIDILEVEFSSIPEVKARISLLKQKIQPLLQK